MILRGCRDTHITVSLPRPLQSLVTHMVIYAKSGLTKSSESAGQDIEHLTRARDRKFLQTHPLLHPGPAD